MIHLPPTENWPARTLAKSFTEVELCQVIAYLECIIQGELIPGPELFKLGISPLDYCMEELEAVQRKLALAISHQRNRLFSQNIPMIGNVNVANAHRHLQAIAKEIK